MSYMVYNIKAIALNTSCIIKAIALLFGVMFKEIA